MAEETELLFHGILRSTQQMCRGDMRDTQRGPGAWRANQVLIERDDVWKTLGGRYQRDGSSLRPVSDVGVRQTRGEMNGRDGRTWPFESGERSVQWERGGLAALQRDAWRRRPNSHPHSKAPALAPATLCPEASRGSSTFHTPPRLLATKCHKIT
ncbi:hypothetical protein AAFF_G00157400 [Aldrovandia affinis]|uniref:Uncharacterized protein n=1 Tax=Aldrovandia affinis TaxID=143900 RepID=A0AAD7RNP9_9TELE|nr:hypothetical protein AAFF_G00157400 [Aldrovandia affinis]